jgi:alpha-N-arabinofuranosidase
MGEIIFVACLFYARSLRANYLTVLLAGRASGIDAPQAAVRKRVRLDNFQIFSRMLPQSAPSSKNTSRIPMPDATITLHLNQPIATISPNLYGHFAEHLGSCIYDGLWVGPDSTIPNTAGIRNDVLTALRRLNIPLLRWPGGCFADDYHWQDGIGPRANRPRRVNLWWGQQIETNAFGTHEFLTLCRLLNAQPYLAGNLGSGSVREMRDWVEYCNYPGDSTLARQRALNGSPLPFNVKYWGVGNEAWGCGGNQDPEDYAAHYRRYATYLRDFEGSPLHLIACGPDGNRPEWTRRFFTKLLSSGPFSTHCHTRLHAFAAHYYCGTAGTATEYTANQWYELLERAAAIEELILTQRKAMDEFDPNRKIDLVIDEWGTWHPPTPGASMLWQQNTLRDALVAAITLDTFNRHADKVAMANIAQIVNVLQAMILTDGDRMLTTPTYHVFEMYKHHQGATSLRVDVGSRDIPFAVGDERRKIAGLSGSASIKNGRLTVSIVNPHASLPVEASIFLVGGEVDANVTCSVLRAGEVHDLNTFDRPDDVTPRERRLIIEGEWHHTFEPASVTVLSASIRSGSPTKGREEEYE